MEIWVFLQKWLEDFRPHWFCLAAVRQQPPGTCTAKEAPECSALWLGQMLQKTVENCRGIGMQESMEGTNAQGNWECYSYRLFVLLYALHSAYWQKSWARLYSDLNNSKTVWGCMLHISNVIVLQGISPSSNHPEVPIKCEGIISKEELVQQ